MGKKIESQVGTLLKDTILTLCKSTLQQYDEVEVQGLIGLTLDHKELFLVSLQELIRNDKGSAARRSERYAGK